MGVYSQPLNPVTQAVQVDYEQVKYNLEHNYEFFIEFFLGEELIFRVPHFHKIIFGKMVDTSIPLFACAVPRDHAKTTLAKLAAVYFFLFTHYRFIVYLSNTSSVAVAAAQDIMGYIQSPNFVSVFGNITKIIDQDGKGYYKFILQGKTCILKALGTGNQVRGLNVDNKRPQLAICDDIQDAEEIETEDQLEKDKKWFYGTFRKALDKLDNKIIHIGNIVVQGCIIESQCKSEFWHSMRFGCLLSNGQPLWPDVWPIEKLKKDFLEYLAEGLIDVWFAEMMNILTLGGNGLIKAKDITYLPPVAPKSGYHYGCVTVDPAISNKSWAHKCVVGVTVYIDYKWQLVDYIMTSGADPFTLYNHIKDLAYKWGVGVVGVEDTAYQASLQFVFPYLAAESGDENFLQFVPLSATESRKLERLMAYAGLLKSGNYVLTEGDFNTTQQLLKYNPKKKKNDDDLIIAAAYVPQMLDRYWDAIVNERIIELNNTALQDSYEVEA